MNSKHRTSWNGMLVLSAFLTFSAQSPANELQTLSGHVPRAAKSLNPVDRLPGTQRLSLAIGLPLRNQAELARLIEQLYAPGSPEFHKYLTTDQFTAKFGPTEKDYQAVIAFAKFHGFTILATHSNRMLLDVTAPVAVIEQALRTTLRVFAHPNEARTFYAPDTEPTLDLAVPVLHISGLDNYELPRASMKVIPPGSQRTPIPAVGTGPNGTFWGKDFRNAYARGVTMDGTGQFLGLLEFDGYYPSDIKSYTTKSKIPAVPLINVALDGFDGTPGTANSEVALDIEMANAMAPGLSAIIVYEGVDGNDILNRMATDNLAKQLSSSWSFPVDEVTTQILQQMAAQGQSYFNASGDFGAYSTSSWPPADNPYVVCVGGTSLHTSSSGAWTVESAWRRDRDVSTGGGISTSESIPNWQQGLDVSTNLGSTSMRNNPDVAMVAESVYAIFDNGGAGAVGGTSCSSPLWAGFTAMVNQQGQSFGLPPVGFLNPAFYAIGQGPGYLTNFHDITVGSNTNTNSLTMFFAVPGYDLCTGWGTPIGQNLINTLAPRPNSIFVTNAGVALVLESCSPTNGAIDPGETVTMNLSLQNLGAIPSTNLMAALQATNGIVAPSSPQNYGALVGGGPAVTLPFSFTADGVCGSNVTATLLLSDGGNTNLGSVQFRFSLGAPANVFSESFDSVRVPALPAGWASAVSGKVTNWVTTTSPRDTPPNSAFVIETTNAGIAELISPPFQVTSATAQLVFRQNYNMETHFDNATNAYDGGVLEIKIGNNGFIDILDAGGSFVTNGYSKTILSDTNDPTGANPLNGRQVWSGLSGGFVTTIVNLPAAAAGQTIQLKWALATDVGNAGGGVGWNIDSVAVQEGYTCCKAATADLAVYQSVSANPALIGQEVTYSLGVFNSGPQAAAQTTVADVLPTNATFSAASAGGTFTNGAVTWDLGSLDNGGIELLTVTLSPNDAGPLSNFVSVASTATEPNPADNQSALVTLVLTSGFPASIVEDLADVLVPAGSNASFLVSAAGIPAPTYQWFFNGLALPGANASSLTLANAELPQAGFYQVVVTNMYGSVTSRVAQLTVVFPPTFDAIGFGTGATKATFSLLSIAGLSYRLEFKNNLSDPNWTPIVPDFAGNGGVLLLEDTNPPTLNSRFYRVNVFR
jgi:uncharacterized repeat protein (TIGR01451 family)